MGSHNASRDHSTPRSTSILPGIDSLASMVITTLRLPSTSGGHALTIQSDLQHIRITAVDGVTLFGGHTLGLKKLPSLSPAPPLADNTAPARAVRSSAFALEAIPVADGGEEDTERLKQLFYALWSIRFEQEIIRLVVPASASKLSIVILQSGAGVRSPFIPPDSDILELLLLREAFWQGALSPQFMPHKSTRNFPLSYAISLTSLRHPIRAPKPPTGAVVYERWIPHLKETLTFHVANPLNDIDLNTFHRWQNDPRVAEGWMETGTLEQHREYLKRQTADEHSIPVIVAFDGEPAVYLEIYWVAEDRLAPFLSPAHPFDRGVHALVGNEKFRGSHRAAAWLSSACHYCFLDDCRTQRVIAEPRLTNQSVIYVAEKFGGLTVTKWFDFPHKRSALMEVSRERFFQLMPFHYLPQSSAPKSVSRL